jgi:hypothetical protein
MRRIFLFIMIMPSLAFGQFKSIILDEAGGDYFQPLEPSIAINPKNPDNIIATAYPDKIYVSQDGGKTWEKSTVSSDGVSGDPVVISDRKGNFYYFYLTGAAGAKKDTGQKIVVHQSKDGGNTWNEGFYLGLNLSKDLSKEWPATDRKGNLYVAWTQFDKYGSEDPDYNSNIFFSFSTNRGKKWNDPIQINQLSGDSRVDDQTTAGAMPAVSSDGKIFIAWAYDNKLYLDRSYDDGKMWLRNDILVTEQPGGWKYDIPGLQRSNGLPVLIADRSNSRLKGMIYLNWSDQRNGSNDTDIWFTSSHNGGDTWSSRVRVNDDIPGKHQFMSRMTQDPETGIIYIVFYDRRDHEDNNTDVYLAYSKNGGRTFKNIKISEEPFVPDESQFLGDYINIDAYNGVVVPIWTRMEEGKTQIAASVIKQEELDQVIEQQ